MGRHYRKSRKRQTVMEQVLGLLRAYYQRWQRSRRR